MQSDSTTSPGRIRFGDFEVDLASHELRRFGRRIRLQEKSFLVLNELLRSPGRVVTRGELGSALWPKEHFVDAEHGLNTAVRRLREVLGDSADEPRFVETLPKLGYRFIGAIEAPSEPADQPTFVDSASKVGLAVAAPVSTLPPPSSIAVAGVPARPLPRGVLAATALLLAVALAIAAMLAVRSGSIRKVSNALPASAPGSSEAVDELLARARYLRNHKRRGEAKQFVEEALKLDPKNPVALAGLAIALFAEGDYEAARETARRAIELDPNAWEAHRLLGNLAYRSGDFLGAEGHYRRAVDANPADSKSRNRLARHLLESGRLEEAREQMLESRRLAPDDPDVQNIWIQYALLTGDYESAIRQGEIWMAIWDEQIRSETVSGVRYLLGLAYVGARRHEDALAQFRAIDPADDLPVALVLGYAGRKSEARAILDAHEATDTAPGSPADPGLAEGMGMAYAVIGDFDRAFEQLDRQVAARAYPAWLHLPLFDAIRRDPRWPPLAERLEREFFSGGERGLL